MTDRTFHVELYIFLSCIWGKNENVCNSNVHETPISLLEPPFINKRQMLSMNILTQQVNAYQLQHSIL